MTGWSKTYIAVSADDYPTEHSARLGACRCKSIRSVSYSISQGHGLSTGEIRHLKLTDSRRPKVEFDVLQVRPYDHTHRGALVICLVL